MFFEVDCTKNVLRMFKELLSLVCNLKLNKYDIVSLGFESF